jgi:hypothetical protein
MLNPTSPFEVLCRFRDGKGWMALEVGASSSNFASNLPAGQTIQKSIVAGSLSNRYPWWKCKDDMGTVFPFLSDGDTGGSTTDGRTAVREVGSCLASPSGTGSTLLVYFNPQTGAQYTDEQMTYIRQHASVLHSDTPLVCTDADADNGAKQSGESSGHELYLYAADDDRLICTPCNSGDCGGVCTGGNSCGNQLSGGTTASASAQRLKSRIPASLTIADCAPVTCHSPDPGYVWTTSASVVSTNVESGSCSGY